MWRARHLHDDRLYECYVAEQTGERVDPPAADHLADCQACQARYAEVSAFMNELRADADTELDAAYSSDTLREQQSQILRRIEHLGHAAHVLSFPKHAPNTLPQGAGRRIAPRWLAAAAAVGLVVGVGVGTVLQSPFARRAPKTAAISAPATAQNGAQAVAQPASQPAAVEAVPVAGSVSEAAGPIDADDEFFLALGSALQRTETPELLAFEELTPHTREVRYTTASYR